MALSANLLIFFAVSTLFFIAIKQRSHHLHKELQIAHELFFTQLDVAKNITLQHHKNAPSTPQVTPFFSSLNSPLISGMAQPLSTLTFPFLYQGHPISIPQETLKGDFLYFTQSTQQGDVYFSSKITNAENDLLITLHVRPHNLARPPALLQTLVETSSHHKPLLLFTDFSENTSKEFFLKQLESPTPTFLSSSAFHIFDLTGEKYSTLWTPLNITPNIQQTLFSSVAISDYRFIDIQSVALFSLSFFCMFFSLLTLGWMEFNEENVPKIEFKKNQFLFLGFINVFFFTISLLILNRPAAVFPTDENLKVLHQIAKQIHNTVFADPVLHPQAQDISTSSYTTKHTLKPLDSFRPPSILPLPELQQYLNKAFLAKAPLAPLVSFFKKTGFGFHLLTITNQKARPIYSSNTHPYLSKTSRKYTQLVQETAIKATTSSLSSFSYKDSKNQHWLTFVAPISTSEDPPSFAAYTLPFESFMPQPIPIPLRALLLGLCLVINFIICWLFFFFKIHFSKKNKHLTP